MRREVGRLDERGGPAATSGTGGHWRLVGTGVGIRGQPCWLPDQLHTLCQVSNFSWATCLSVRFIWALPKWWGGGLGAYQDGLGHFFREELFKRALAWLWGVKMLARMVWGTYAVKIEVQMGICFC